MSTEHIPVMLKEVIEGLNIKPEGTYVDLTLGRGGHSEAILKKIKSGLLVGFDQDQTAIITTSRRLVEISDRFALVHANFSSVKAELNARNIESIDGALMDLGVSSPQFDQGERGFSYRFDAKLDMRMDQTQLLTAHTIVNTYDLAVLTRLFREYGEEKFAYEIARNIIKRREVKTIDTTFELVDIIKATLPKKTLLKKGHPAKQIFQALRIATNDELEVLQIAVHDVLGMLRPGGRLAIITFHSGEDRIVKNIFKDRTIVKVDRRGPQLYPDQETKPEYRLINHKVICASEEEIKLNPRAESAKLRIIEKM